MPLFPSVAFRRFGQKNGLYFVFDFVSNRLFFYWHQRPASLYLSMVSLSGRSLYTMVGLGQGCVYIRRVSGTGRNEPDRLPGRTTGWPGGRCGGGGDACVSKQPAGRETYHFVVRTRLDIVRRGVRTALR